MFLFQKIIVACTTLLQVFIYKTEPVLPYYINDLKCNNLECNDNCNDNCSIGKRCLDGDMDSVFFI